MFVHFQVEKKKEVLNVKITKILMAIMLIFVLLSSSVYPYQVKSHLWVTEQAIRIVCEKYPEFKPILEQYRKQIYLGVVETDTKPEKNIPDTYSDKHFQDPETHRGIQDTSAGKMCKIYIEAAAKAWKKGDKEKCFYLLGIALHFIEDTSGITLHSNPMVTGNIPTNGFHGKYEAYMGSLVEDHPERYLTNEIIYPDQIVSFKKGGKTHCDPNSPEGWVDYGAHQSAPYYERIKNGDKAEFDAVALETIPLSEKLAAGFIVYFLDTLRIPSLMESKNILVDNKCQIGDIIIFRRASYMIAKAEIREIVGRNDVFAVAKVKWLWVGKFLKFRRDIIRGYVVDNPPCCNWYKSNNADEPYKLPGFDSILPSDLNEDPNK